MVGFGWNIWAIPIGIGLLYYIWRPRKVKLNNVTVKTHTRRLPKKTQEQTKQDTFRKRHMAGLKGRNPVKFARKLRVRKLEEKRDTAAEKSYLYFKEGEFRKAEQYGKIAAKYDNEVNMVN